MTAAAAAFLRKMRHFKLSQKRAGEGARDEEKRKTKMHIDGALFLDIPPVNALECEHSRFGVVISNGGARDFLPSRGCTHDAHMQFPLRCHDGF